MKRPHFICAVLLSVMVFFLAGSLSFVRTKASPGETGAQQETLPPPADRRITVQAAGRGNPWINLRDGQDLLTAYSGPDELRQALEHDQAQPLSLCAADYDEDGVPDLVSGYGGATGGILTLHRGNVDSIYPNAPEAQQRKAAGEFTDAPFLSPGFVFAIPEAADFVGGGDFDGDGHWDVVAAARGSNKLYLLSGDGRGGLGLPKQIELPGAVTALATGEVNRRDGLDDVVVGVAGSGGPQALVFEGPNGALRATPEVFALPAEATALALGQLDDEYTMDLAVAAGSNLVVIHGRDRKLSLDDIRQAEVPQATISARSFPFALKLVALGNFTGDHRTDMAVLSEDGAIHLLSKQKAKGLEGWNIEMLTTDHWPLAAGLVRAKVSSLPKDDLVVIDRASDQLHILTGEAATVSASLDVEDGPVAVLPMRLNADALNDLVILKSGRNALTVAMTSPMAVFTVNSTSDGNDCDPNDGICSTGTIDPNTGQCVLTGECTLRAAIQQANASAGADTISFGIGTGVQTINVGSTTGQRLPTITSPVIIDGTTQPGFAGSPLIELNGASTGGFDSGLHITAGSSTVRGLVINRFPGSGITLDTAGGNIIAGNYIGTDVSGTTDLGNNFDGVFSRAPNNNTIGGTAASARNVISGNNRWGIFISAIGSLVQGNYIGTDVSGTADLGNSSDGVHIRVTANTIGGTAAGVRNVISGNNDAGILIFGSSATGNLVQGNYIGTDVSGTADLGNVDYGVNIDDTPNNTIGGTAADARNIISGNFSDGIFIHESSATGNQVQGNYVGTDVSGTATLGNTQGVVISGAANNAIGGTAAGARNVISGNDVNGIAIAAPGNQVQGNYIGTDVSGTANLGNSQGGIFIQAQSTTIGGTTSGAGNTVAFNVNHGVFVVDINNAILSNSIHSNTGLGIDLGFGGTPANDACDADTGPNNVQNFPVLTSASTTAIQGTLNSTANTTFTIQFFANSACDPSGHGEGQTFIGSTTVTTDANCNASFSFPASLSAGQVITATATDPAGNTSQFSACVTVVPPTGCTITCPANQTANNAPGQCGAVVNYPAPTTTGNCGAVTCTPPAGAVFPPGTTTVTCATATGPSCSFTVTVSPVSILPSRLAITNLAPTAAPNQVIVTAMLTEFGTNAALAGRTINFQVGANMASAATNSSGVASATVNLSGSGSFIAQARFMGNATYELSAARSTFNLSQQGGCNYLIFKTDESFAASGGSGAVNVRTFPAACDWTATANDLWILISAGGSGSGDGAVSYNVAAHTSSANRRTGTITIAGLTHTVLQGVNFLDVPQSNIFYTQIGKLSARGVTLGCGGGNYCPSANVTREQMAAFIIRALGDFNPPPPAMQRFNDVPPTNIFYAFIEQLAVRQITLGCSANPPLYCPQANVTREQMAAFLMRALGEFTPPLPPEQRFADVPPTNIFYAFIEQLAVRRITLGCGNCNYCPQSPVTREQMAAFLVRAFGL